MTDRRDMTESGVQQSSTKWRFTARDFLRTIFSM
jgi:hypothetical protein